MNPTFKIFWSDEDNAFICQVEGMPGVSAFGDSPVIALKECLVALESLK